MKLFVLTQPRSRYGAVSYNARRYCHLWASGAVGDRGIPTALSCCTAVAGHAKDK
jgi:hypothetical protein